MSEQAKIIAQMQEIVMSILKNGSASIEEADMIDTLEGLLHKQKCFIEIEHTNHTNQGEEIASLFFNDQYTQAIDKMYACEITPDDFFGYVEYYFDDDHEDEALTQMFTNTFISGVNKAYALKQESK